MALNINGTTGISGVDGSVSAPALTGTDSNTGITFPSADTIKFSTGGVERMSITNSGITGIAAGITQADQWRITSNFSVSVNSDTYMTSNWERNDSTGYGLLGTGMSESSGEFTFPATGIYLVQLHTEVYFSTNQNPRLMCRIYATTDGSSYSYIALGTCHAKDGGFYASSDAFAQFDVTNTSTHKVKFLYYHTGASGAATITGNSSVNETFAGFIRLGDT